MTEEEQTQDSRLSQLEGAIYALNTAIGRLNSRVTKVESQLEALIEDMDEEDDD